MVCHSYTPLYLSVWSPLSPSSAVRLIETMYRSLVSIQSAPLNLNLPTYLLTSHTPPLPVAYSLHLQERRMGGGGGAVRGEGAKWTGPVYFVFCRLCPSSPQPTRSCLAPPVIFLLLTNTEPPVRACQCIWLERFRESQKRRACSILSGRNEQNVCRGPSTQKKNFRQSYIQYSVWLYYYRTLCTKHVQTFSQAV